MKRCANCGTELEETMRFCSNCGKPCGRQTGREATKIAAAPHRSPAAPRRRSSYGIRDFLAGTAIGVLFTHIFGHSSASASPTHATTENFHETVIYDHEDCDEEHDCSGYEHCDDTDWEGHAVDEALDGYGSDHDGDYDDAASGWAPNDFDDTWDDYGDDYGSDDYDCGGFDDDCGDE